MALQDHYIMSHHMLLREMWEEDHNAILLEIIPWDLKEMALEDLLVNHRALGQEGLHQWILLGLEMVQNNHHLNLLNKFSLWVQNVLIQIGNAKAMISMFLTKMIPIILHHMSVHLVGMMMCMKRVNGVKPGTGRMIGMQNGEMMNNWTGKKNGKRIVIEGEKENSVLMGMSKEGGIGDNCLMTGKMEAENANEMIEKGHLNGMIEETKDVGLMIGMNG